MAWLNGRTVRLTALQFELLATLMAARGRMVSADALRQAVWHNTCDTGTNRLAVHIHHIRRALADAANGAGQGVSIVAGAGGGYRLIL